MEKMKAGCLLVGVLFVAFALAPLSRAAAGEAYRAAVDPDGVQRIAVEGGDYYFKPGHIVVRVNVPVELTVKKAPGLVPHDIMMDSPGAGMAFHEDFGEQGVTIRFTPTRTGTYPFYCHKKLLFFKGHRERGMEGVMEVVE